MQLCSVRKSAIGEPELLQKALGIHYQAIAVPLTDGTTVIQRVIRIAPRLALLLASICIDDAIVPIHASNQDEYPLMVPIFCKLNTIAHHELPRATRRKAIEICRIVFQEVLLAVNIKVTSPGLKWGDLFRIADVVQ